MSQIENSRRITVAEMAPHVHSFLPNENKVDKIANWLIIWIKKSLQNGTIKPNDYLPIKGDLAFHIGVSLGTIQSVYRIVEDKGLIESRQKIGSYIKDPAETEIEKLTSKREIAVECIKKYIKDNHLNNEDAIVSARSLSKQLLIPYATVHAALNSLILSGIIEKKNNNFIVKDINYKVNYVEQQTLVEKIAEYINKYIKDNLNVGDKLPSNDALADMFKVSVKTIHDSIKILSLAGIVKTRRGYYGTVVINQSEDDEDNKYFYEKVELYIKKYIAENCSVGSKLPSIKNFAEVFNVSTKTIKNALDNLAYDGYLTFTRGRYGGTFVTNIPTVYDKSYTWLALSPDFIELN